MLMLWRVRLCGVQGDHFSMLLVLPSKRHGLAEVVQGLNEQHILAMLAPGPPRRTVLLMPRFQLGTEVSLSRTLKQVCGGTEMNTLQIPKCDNNT